VFPLLIGTDHPKRDSPEQDEQPNNSGVQNPEDAPLDVARQLLGEVVDEETGDQDGEVERWILIRRKVSYGKGR
jgi:hypothetical protein